MIYPTLPCIINHQCSYCKCPVPTVDLPNANTETINTGNVQGATQHCFQQCICERKLHAPMVWCDLCSTPYHDDCKAIESGTSFLESSRWVYASCRKMPQWIAFLADTISYLQTEVNTLVSTNLWQPCKRCTRTTRCWWFRSSHWVLSNISIHPPCQVTNHSQWLGFYHKILC